MSDFQSVEILLVEDNPTDAELTMRALRKSHLANSVTWFKDGAQALDFIYRRDAYSALANNLPKLILLDLKLPKVDGIEVLRQLKSDERTKTIPVVVLTSSRAEEDVLKSYGLHANCYIVKPIDLDQFIQVVQSIENFWLCVVTLASPASAWR